MAKKTNTQKELEQKRMRHEDRLDNRLWDIIEEVSKPAKFGISLDGSIIDAYPHVVLADDYSYTIKDVVYKPYKYNLAKNLPKELLMRYEQLLHDVKGNNPEKYLGDDEAIGRRKKYAKVTPQKIKEIVQLYKEGCTRTDIAEAVGVSKSTVTRCLKDKIEKIEKVSPPKDMIKDWKEYRELGFSYAEIADGYDVTESTVHYYLNRKEKKKAGRKAKYSIKDVEKWVGLKDTGLTYTQVAEQVGISKGTVKNYVHLYKKERKKEQTVGEA